MVREAVPDESQLPLFDVLFDGIEWLFFRNLHFGVGPTRDFDDHVEDATIKIGKEGNVMERGEDCSSLLGVNTVV